MVVNLTLTLTLTLACWVCVEYFSNGHTGFHVRLIKSNYWFLNALVWGTYATWIIGFWFGLILSFITTTPALSPLPNCFLVVATGCGVAVVVGVLVAEYMAYKELVKWPSSRGGYGENTTT